jgi:hypothetical protein
VKWRARWPLTAAEFEAAYAARSGVSVEYLHWAGRFAQPCDCGWDDCQGWEMGHQWEDALARNELPGPSPGLAPR